MKGFRKMISKIKDRLSSNRGDSNSVSALLWIALAVVIIVAVGKILYDAITSKGNDIGESIKKSDKTLFTQ